MLSVDSGHGDTARTLLEAGAAPGVINKDGQTAADLAAGWAEERPALQGVIASFASAGVSPRLVAQHTRQPATQPTEMDSVLKKMEMDHLIDTFRDQNIDFEG